MRRLAGGLAGGAVGFVIAAAIYLSVNPILEAVSGPVRELQGLLWNSVPLTTAAGFALGWWLTTRPPRGTS